MTQNNFEEEEADWEAGEIEDVEVLDFDEPEDPDGTEDMDESEDGPLPVRKPIRPVRLYLTGIVTGFLLVILIELICDIFNLHPFSGTPAADKTYDLTQVVETYIDKYFWKPAGSDEKLAQYAAKGMVVALGDPYSLYMTPEELGKLKEHNDGDYTGIGVTVVDDPGTTRTIIKSVKKDGPADKAGMKIGDEIVAVDGVDVTEKTTDDITPLLRGQEGTDHVITVLREKSAVSGGAVSGESSAEDNRVRIDISVMTQKIVNKSVYYQKLKNDIGYLQITSFDRETPKQFRTAMNGLEKKGCKAIIMDVRNNPGGVLSAVLSVLDRLLPEGPVLTETRKGQKDTTYRSTSKEQYSGEMVVLINGTSASAAEVFAGALQDRKSVRLIGEKSYGKGIMQSIYTLPGEQGGLKLTTGEYLLPSGRSIHEKGLTPDVEVVFDAKKTDYGTNKDNQLMKAMEVITS